ncbi:uncharacterized protein LACBIDRAFT_301316 [Laccaria bicolor S238N-H82]|uniref:Predicted protein n=1 Tax=Laccaria bicolor (strain S238N-H82 / ATCC MYA-4686) TaxID=486041 RepID=B0CN93_LACBS|nr:uncharacterized protein LACBIDRAFT_301316 [Laccaria bicolor S238N-H82]EDR15263.1 predicted protein [Laccaria bicolor S238N-H82]|eukprot:XP_001873471.1 predicted protein [Laccaria bicolor S238N-H82]
MELILNASQSDKTERSFVNAIRYDVHEADTLEAEERRDAARQRYQRSYWESVPEDGREPILPGSLEHAKAAAKRYVERGDKLKASPRLMPRIPDTEYLKRPKEPVQIFEKPGRPAFKFVDVGAKFMDVDERIHRMTTAGRNSKRRLQRSVQKEESRKVADAN